MCATYKAASQPGAGKAALVNTGSRRPRILSSNHTGELQATLLALRFELRELGMRTSTTGRGQAPRAEHPLDFYTCPDCKGPIYAITRDLYGNPVYDCPKCHRRFDTKALEQAQLANAALSLRLRPNR